jgi:hypothetical protein
VCHDSKRTAGATHRGRAEAPRRVAAVQVEEVVRQTTAARGEAVEDTLGRAVAP